MKNLFVITILFMNLLYLSAQDLTPDKKQTFYFGTRVGINDYSINSEKPIAYGYYGGLFFEQTLSDKWSFQLETNFNYSGTSTLQLPLLMKYRISDKFQLLAGPQIDYSFEQRTLDISSRNKRWGWSFNVGAEYQLSSHWFIDARYNHGLTNQFPVSQGDNSSSMFAKKHSFNLGFGYKF